MRPWQETMEKLRARTPEPGLANPGHAAKLGGLDLLQAMIEGRVPDPPISRTLDFYLLEVERGRAVFQGEPKFAHYNPIGSVHGGWHAALLDSAMACAVHTLVEPGAGYTTLEFKVHCVRPLTEKSGLGARRGPRRRQRPAHRHRRGPAGRRRGPAVLARHDHLPVRRGGSVAR
jgi:uncharacterized protein (TIGR00369 family)